MSLFRRLWTNVHQIWSCRRVIAVSNAVFQSTISCSCPEIFAIKSQNAVVGNYVFGPKILGEKDPPISDADILSPKGTHQVGKFGAILQQIQTISAKVHQIIGQFSNFRR